MTEVGYEWGICGTKDKSLSHIVTPMKELKKVHLCMDIEYDVFVRFVAKAEYEKCSVMDLIRSALKNSSDQCKRYLDEM